MKEKESVRIADRHGVHSLSLNIILNTRYLGMAGIERRNGRPTVPYDRLDRLSRACQCGRRVYIFSINHTACRQGNPGPRSVVRSSYIGFDSADFAIRM